MNILSDRQSDCIIYNILEIVAVFSTKVKIEFIHLQLFLEGTGLREDANLLIVVGSNDGIFLREWNL